MLVVLASLLGTSWLFWVASPAAAAIVLSPSEGPRGTTVGVTVTGIDPVACRVLFDGTVVATSPTCTGALSFAVPLAAAAGSHGVAVLSGDGGPGGAGGFTIGTATFTVPADTTTTTETTSTTTTTETTVTTQVPGTVARPASTVPTVPTVPGTAPPTTLEPAPPSTILIFPEINCLPSTPPVQRLGTAPASGPAGTDVTVAVDWQAGGTCSVRPGRLTFDGEAVGGPIPSTTGPVSVPFTVPSNAEPGPHTIAVVAVDSPGSVLATTPFEVEAPAVEPSSSSGLPIAAGVVGAAVLALGAVALVARSRGGGGAEGEPAAPPADPCGADRVLLVDARLGAAAARADVEQAQQRARAAEDRVEDRRRELDSSADGERSRPALPLALPVLNGERNLEPYLLDHENPHTPRRPNGKRGWYRDQRTQPVRGIVVSVQRSAGPRTSRGPADAGPISAGAVASGLAYAPQATSAHVVVDGDGVVGLLPDDHVALHRPDVDEADESVLVVLVAASSPEGTIDDKTLKHAAAWCSPRLRKYGIAAEHLTADRWAAGANGFVGGGDVTTVASHNGEPGPDFPWDRFLPLLRDHGPRAIPGILPGRHDEATADPGAQGEVEQAEAEAEAAREEARQAEVRAREAETRVEALFRSVAECQCRVLPPPEVVVIAPPVEEPDEEEQDGRFYLIEHENPNALLRENGKRGWYYPSRSQPIRGIVVHTAESMNAEGVAAYLAAVDRAAAAHVVIDTEVTVPLLPDEATAFHAPGGNSMGLGIEIAYKAALWGTQAPTEEMLLMRSAAWCGLKARLYGIPMRRVSIEQWEAGEKGFIAHAQLDPIDRSDPGPDFPWDRFLALTAKFAGQSSGAEAPATEGRGTSTT